MPTPDPWPPTSYREPSADVADEEEGVVLQVAHHGVAAAQLGGPPVALVVVGHGAVGHHGQHHGEDPLGGRGQRAKVSG